MMKYINILLITIGLGSCSTQEPLLSSNIRSLNAVGDTILIQKFSNYLDYSDSSCGRILIDGTNKAINGGFKDPIGSTNVNAGNATVGNLSVPVGTEDMGYEYDLYNTNIVNLFGDSVNFSTSGGYYSPFSGKLYLSPIIAFSSPGQTSDSSSVNRKIYRNTGKTITWNADANNTLGVAIYIQFDPNNDPGRNIALKNSTPVTHLIIVPDNGSYQILTENLVGIPGGADIDVTIARVNYKIVKDNNNNMMKVEGHSHSTLMFRVLD